ncbi:TPA: hypothetical protein JZG04_004653 [Escherichia coli]|nr:hypothetical protein [Escherichia coli]HAX4856523.1 hypothetical protein [Escherichia coli]HAX4916583.1 hypothetical protein [Escherichia coli]HAX4925498.1 hypothetical protein [Escherichia coli]HAX4948729.1 hypothetical protein [Escherichia coli]
MKISSGCSLIPIATAMMGCSAMALAAPPPAEPPLYALSQQTTTPAETLNTVVKNIPAVEKGKKYEVRVEVREVTPPPTLDMDALNP